MEYWISPTPAPGTRVPIGEAKLCRAGSDVSVIGYGAQVLDALQVAESMAGEGVDVEVVDLRTIQPFDREAIMASVAKTKRAVVAHEARARFGPGAEIASQIYEELFSELVAPVQGPGVYRVEVRLDGRPWIFSNPIYVKAPA